MNTESDKIKIYGATWCGDYYRVTFFFEQHNMKFEYIDIDSNPQAEQYVIDINPNGFRSIPVVEINSICLIEPSFEDLAKAFLTKDGTVKQEFSSMNN